MKKVNAVSLSLQRGETIHVGRREFLQLGLGLAAASQLKGQKLDWREVLKSRLYSPRSVVSLNGDWLFMPAHQLGQGTDPHLPGSEDRSWPKLPVPNFWRPIEWEINTPAMGASERFLMLEQERVAAYGFDALNTRAGWYRRWIQIPPGLEGLRFTVRFGGVATIAQVWWNGQSVGSHVGMFGPFECDVTPYVQFGKPNLLAVFVSSGQYLGSGNPREIKGVAVTVEITQEMLNSLPQAGYEMMGTEGGGGIWQGVDLVVTAPTRIEDVFLRPRLDGGALEVTVSNRDERTSKRRVCCRLTDRQTGLLFYEDREGVEIETPAGGEGTIQVQLGGLQPKLWWPEQPDCYDLRTTLHDGNRLIDVVHSTVGFRTFEVRGQKFYLNGEPYFLRGANTPPYGLNPNSEPLAKKFIRFMHEGNQFITRFHHTAPNEIWLDACDTIGVGAAIEGEWPYTMSGNTAIPAQEIVNIWHRDQIEKFKSVRNHPCVLLWDLNNEWRFHAYPEGELGTQTTQKIGYFDTDSARRLKKWEIVSAMVKDVRRIDGTRPVICSSEYTRVPREYENDLKPRGLDDGDIDDIHVYNGIYGPSVFNLDVPRDLEKRYGNPDRPLISLEPSTGYPDNDTGYWTRSYIDTYFVPQAWVGQYVRDEANPMLKYHAVITKEYIEKIRRERGMIAGWILFGNENWFRHPYDPEHIEPYPTYYAAKLALSPVLITLHQMNRHFETSQKAAMDVHIVHDDFRRRPLDGLRIEWAILDGGGKSLSHGASEMPAVDYYGRVSKQVTFEMPPDLPSRRNEATLALSLWKEDDLISKNEYSLLLAKPSWYRFDDPVKVVLIGRDAKTAAYLESINLKPDARAAADWKQLTTEVVVVSPQASQTALGKREEMQTCIKSGGRVFFAEASERVAAYLPLAPALVSAKYKESWDRPAEWGAEYVDVAPNTPLAYQIVPVDDVRWWNADDGVGPRVADRIFDHPEVLQAKKNQNTSLRSLADYLAPHGYISGSSDLDKFRGSAVIEWSLGTGKLLASTLRLAEDPAARKILAKQLRYLMKL